MPPSTVLASRLKPGDRIGVVSPSGVVTPALRGQLDRGVRFLEELGFEVVLGRNALSSTLGYTATPAEKALDLNAMFADPSIRAVICSQGGQTANPCLPLLELEVIRRDPKVFLGISDITVLLNAIQARTGLVTFHGDDVMWGFGREVSPYTREAFLDRFVRGRIGPIPPSGGGRRTVRGGVAEGRLAGGNLGCLIKLAGTPWFPDFDGAILLLEDYGFSPEAVHCHMHHLGQLGVLDRIAGVVVGHIHDDDAASRTVQYEDVVATVLGERRLPVLKMSEFGHNCPNAVLPVGGLARLDADRGELEILEPCLR